MRLLIVSALVLAGYTYGATRTYTSYEAPKKTYLGFAADSAVTGYPLPAASLLLGVAENLNIQTYFLIPTIDPFLFAIAGNAKFTIFGNQQAGFHVGGGLGFSLISAAALSATDTRDLVLRFNGIAGAHFYLVSRVYVVVDGGLTMALNIDNSDADMTLGSNSGLLGLSVLYEL